MSNIYETDNGTDWSISGDIQEVVEVYHIEEQRELILTRDDLLKMLAILDGNMK